MASAKIMTEKEKKVNEIIASLKVASTIIFFDYRGLSVAEITELRNQLNQEDSEMKIYKNTLTKLALANLKINLKEDLKGPNAIVFSNAIVEPLKILTNYAKKHKLLQLKIGIIDGKISERPVLEKLATIPPRDVLLTMMARGMVVKVRDLAMCLRLYSEQKNN